MEEWEARDGQIDEYLEKLERGVKFVFMQALNRISDDPRDLVFDILLLDMLNGGMDDLIRTMPFRARALSITRTLPEDAPPGTTQGLEEASRGVQNVARGAIREVSQEVATLAGQMALFGQTGFKQAVKDLLDRAVAKLVKAFDQALVIWDRVVLDKIGGLKDDPVWIYEGPADKNNRPFCGVVVRQPRAYTRTGIDSLNAHPLLASYVPPNVFMLCGGHGCRHVFMPVSRQFAEAKGLEIV